MIKDITITGVKYELNATTKNMLKGKLVRWVNICHATREKVRLQM